MELEVENTYTFPVLVIDMLLLERAQDFLLQVFREILVTVDEVGIALAELGPGFELARSHAGPAIVSGEDVRRGLVKDRGKRRLSRASQE